MLREIPRGVEVLIKKAAVDPAFKKTLLAKRARAADDIALKLSPAEAAMLDAVPENQLRAIINRTKVSPNLRPAFLGTAATVMLAALGATVITRASGRAESLTLGISPDRIQPLGSPRTPHPDPADWDLVPEYSVVIGRVLDSANRPVKDAEVKISTSEGDKSALTDGNGEFIIEGVRLGRWTAYATRAGYETRTREDVLVLKGYKTNLTFILSEKGRTSHKTPSVDGIRPDRP